MATEKKRLSSRKHYEKNREKYLKRSLDNFHSGKGKEAQKKYRESEKGKAYVKNYNASKGAASRKKYRESEKGKAWAKRRSEILKERRRINRQLKVTMSNGSIIQGV